MSFMKLIPVILVLFLFALTQAQSCNILLTNDDGVESPALIALEAALSKAGHKVLTVAPSKGRSAASSSRNPISIGAVMNPPPTFRLERLGPNKYSFDGTPVDAVEVALKTVVPTLNRSKIDLVISGPNIGQNLGLEGGLQSGTVSAALHASVNNIPAFAVSIGALINEAPRLPSTIAAIPTVARGVATFVTVSAKQFGCGNVIPERNVLNVNVPVPLKNVTGVQFATLGTVSQISILYKDMRDDLAEGRRADLVQTPIFADPTTLNGDVLWFVRGKITITVLSPNLGVAGSMKYLRVIKVVRRVLGNFKISL